MKRLRHRLSRLPIRWKLTIVSTLVICLLFVVYNVIQYFMLSHWIVRNEEEYASKTVHEIQAHLESVPDLAEQQTFLESMNEKYQMLRVLDRSGHVVISVTNGVPSHWVEPRVVSSETLEREMHLEETLIVYRVPVRDGTLELVRNLKSIEQMMKLNLIVLLAGTLAGLAISWLGGAFLSRRFLKPLMAISDTMRRIKNGGLQERVDVTGTKDEISELGEIFNEMMDRLERSFQQQKQFVEDASHELRTPITILQGHLSMLNRWGKSDPAVLEESLAAMTSETQRLNKLVLELLELTRAEPNEQYPTSLIAVAPVVRRVAENLMLVHPETDIRLQFTGSDDPQALVKAEHLEQILVILLDNAIHYSQPSRRINLTVEQHRTHASLTIRDFGEGIPKEELPYLFDRFYRVDKARSRQHGGHGLGLSIAKRLVEQHGGSIRIESEIGAGTTVTMQFLIENKQAL